MTAKKKQILGPDGKPLDVAKYRPKPDPEPMIPIEPVVFPASDRSFTHTFRLDFDTTTSWQRLISGISTTSAGSSKPAIKAAVEKQLAELHAAVPDDWKGHEEAPPPPPELTDTYAVAFGSARKKCEHENSHSTLYARRERQCDDCGRYFHRKGMWE